jgi:MurNAc alpha-1-phosphate uridylyltransferase|tara:strand:- start:244 stop:909 length:666 start_codon:yes stop_codon:yes gene_type:complete
MKAFILSAGKGSRLKPFTINMPKPLYSIKGKPLIVWNIERLKSAGITDIVINLFHKGNKIREFLKDGRDYGVNITYSIEDNLLGTGGGVANMIEHFTDEPFIVLSGDVWSDFNFRDLKLNENYLAHMVLIRNSPSYSKGDVALKDGIVSTNGNKSFTYGGISLISPFLFKDTGLHEFPLWEGVLEPAVVSGMVTGECYEGKLININSIEQAKELDALLGEE